MAYADQQMSGNKITALIIVAILHVVVGYALVTGLAYSAFKKIKEVTTAVQIDPDKPPPPPPPPPKTDRPPPPPIVAPPPPITFNAPAQQVTVVTSLPPAAPPPAPVVLPPPPPSAPPPPSFTPKAAQPKGRPGEWVTTNDYPSRALREDKEGVTGFRLTVGTDGKVQDCQITRSSGTPELDDATCANLRRRGRFNVATDGDGKPTTGTYSSSVRWQIPKD
ncbi:MAG: energy transducer TonB [Novosphingobium sp. 12-62-10]|nr:MAG: energy transducer TonB [Novosphingobium sp. 12-62-10]